MKSAIRRVTAADVAAAAGVSKTTVSYVLNNVAGQTIPPETRQRVIEAARLLNYTSSSSARALRKGRNDTVLLILRDWPLGRSMTRVIELLTDKLAEQGLSLILHRETSGRSVISLWLELTPAVVVTLGPIDEEDRATMEASGTFVAASITTAFGLRQDEIGGIQARHLVHRGHSRVAYVMNPDPRIQEISDLRRDGFRSACKVLNLLEPTTLALHQDINEARAGVQKLLREGVTGAAAYNDEMAVVLLAALRSIDKHAPEDLAVIGVDDDAFAPFTHPPLTTVRQNHALLADRVAKRIARAMGGPHAGTDEQDDMLNLIVRGST